MTQKTIYYESYQDDVVTSKNQAAKLPVDHQWIHHNLFYRCFSQLFYYLVVVISIIYCYGWLHLRFQDLHKLHQNSKKGGVVYCNHTQPLGDVFLPFLAAFPKRPYIICSQANLGLPIIGKLLTFAGALIIPDGKKQFHQFNQAVQYHLNQQHLIFIYPEAHVWPYFTEIRPFTATSFHYPAAFSKPSFSLTVTYQAAKYYKRPQIIVYTDGPFTVDAQLLPKQKQFQLYHQIRHTMITRSHLSNFQYINYQKRKDFVKQ